MAWLEKPEPLKRYRARKRTDRKAARRECVLAVWERDGWRCRHCGKPVKQSSLYAFELGHVHEWPMKGASSNDGTDPRLAFLLCEECHLRGTHGWPRLVPEYLDAERGAYGEIGWRWQSEKAG